MKAPNINSALASIKALATRTGKGATHLAINPDDAAWFDGETVAPVREFTLLGCRIIVDPTVPPNEIRAVCVTTRSVVRIVL